MVWPQTYQDWKESVLYGWDLYKWTWRGFRTSKGFLVVDEADKYETDKSKQDTTAVQSDATVEEMTAQAKSNAEFLKEEAINLTQKVQDHTGVHNKDDLKMKAAELMRLATDCVNEFMKGYRKGRDDEVERMLTEYFQELEKEMKKEIEKPPRRRTKRRVLNRNHPLFTSKEYNKRKAAATKKVDEE